MEDNEDIYYMILYTPKDYINTFKTKDEFKSACEVAEILDLEELLKVFEDHELYEYCAIIKDVLDNKIMA